MDFKALIETGGVRAMKLFMSRTRHIGVGLVSNKPIPVNNKEEHCRVTIIALTTFSKQFASGLD